MFTFPEKYTFDWPVRVKIPVAGAEIVQEFTGTFLLPNDELEIFEKIDATTASEMVEAARARLSKWLVGWSGIKTESGAELPYSEANRDNLLRQRAIRLAVDIALSEAVLGVPSEGAPGIREKN